MTTSDALVSVADFRSDTVTAPTPAMREAMAQAKVGDDVFDEDPTVHELQALGAERLGQEAALFLPSGTMANVVAIALQARRGDEVLLEEASHPYLFEGGGTAWIVGAQPRPIPSDRGRISPETVLEYIRPLNDHFPRTTLLCVENSHNMHGGTVVPLTRMRELRTVCDEHGLKLHLDGARLFNAAHAAGEPVKAFAEVADTVSISLAKGLGGPVGSLLAGSRAAITEARRIRKVLGGGMRQAGVIAAAGLVALREGPTWLGEDHRRAHDFAAGIREIAEHFDIEERLEAAEPETNMVFVRLPYDEEAYTPIVEALAAQQVRVIALPGRGMRFVFHHQITDEHVRRALDAIRDAVAKNLRA